MLYMNEYDIESAKRTVEITRPDWKVTLEAIAILERLVEWTNTHSDGWAYWPLPCRAARQLQERIQEQEAKTREYRSEVYDLTYNDRDTALRPIKAFITKQIAGGGADESDRLWILEGKTPAEVV